MILCHINPKRLIKLSYGNDFDIVGDENLGYYSWNLVYGKEHSDDRHDLFFYFFHADTKKYSHAQAINAVPNSIIEDREMIHNMAKSMLSFSKIMLGI